MEYVAVIAVIAVIIYFVTQKNSSTQDGSLENEPSQKESVKQESFRLHTKMDVPMIRSRIEKLDFANGLETHAKKKLDKIILDVCSGEEKVYWWEPLRRFSQLPNASKGAKFMFVNAMSIEGKRIIEFILNLSEMIRFCGLRLNSVEDKDGEKIPAYHLDDEEYSIIAAVGDKTLSIPMVIKDAQIDMVALIESINKMLQKYKSTHRMVVLEPDGSVFCLLCTGYIESKHAARFQ